MPVVVPRLDDFAIEVRIIGAGADREVVVQERRTVVSLQQEQAALAGRKAERMHPEVREVIHVPRIGDQEPFDRRRELSPTTGGDATRNPLSST